MEPQHKRVSKVLSTKFKLLKIKMRLLLEIMWILLIQPFLHVLEGVQLKCVMQMALALTARPLPQFAATEPLKRVRTVTQAKPLCRDVQQAALLH